MRISIIVATLNRFEDVCRTVAALLACDFPDFQIVVADQSRIWPDDWLARRDLLRIDPRVVWLELGLIGVVKARNQAVKHSDGELLIFVDDDVILSGPSFLADHAECYRNGEADAVSGRELDGREMPTNVKQSEWMEARLAALTKTDGPMVQGNALHQCLTFDRQSCHSVQRVCIFCTCNASVRRSAFIGVGGFDEQFGGNSYGDDYDLAIRLHNAGRKIFYNPRPVLIHLRTPIGGLRVSDPNNPFTHREKAFSRWLFYFRYRDPCHRWSMLKQVLRTTIFTKPHLKSPRIFLAACMGAWQARSEASEVSKAAPRSIFTESWSSPSPVR